MIALYEFIAAPIDLGDGEIQEPVEIKKEEQPIEKETVAENAKRNLVPQKILPFTGTHKVDYGKNLVRSLSSLGINV